jgi:uncharacterized protein YqeY
MKAQDRSAVSAIRSALGAIDNAEAVDVSRPPQLGAGPIAYAVPGVGGGDVARRQLSEPEIIEIVRAEVVERIVAARAYDQIGRDAEATQLRAEAATLEKFVDLD